MARTRLHDSRQISWQTRSSNIGGEIPTKRLPLSSLSPVDGRTVILTLVAIRLIAN